MCTTLDWPNIAEMTDLGFELLGTAEPTEDSTNAWFLHILAPWQTVFFAPTHEDRIEVWATR